MNTNIHQEEIVLNSIEKLEKGTTRIIITIKGKAFKRLSHPMYPPVWNDIEHHFNDCEAMTSEQESDLEGIFLAWVEQNRTLLNKIDSNHIKEITNGKL